MADENKPNPSPPRPKASHLRLHLSPFVHLLPILEHTEPSLPQGLCTGTSPDTLPQRSAWPAPSHYSGLSSRCCLLRGTSSIWLNVFSIAVAFAPKQQILVHRSTCSQVCQLDSQLLDMGRPAYVLTVGFLMPGTEPGTLEAPINIY